MPREFRVARVSESVRSKLLLAACAALAGVSATSALAQSQTFTVTSLNDSGAGTLRDAINQANALSIPAVIRFNVTGGGSQINLSSMLPVLENSHGIQIDGSNGGLGPIQINGGANSNTTGDRIFFVGVASGTPAAGGGFLASTATTNFSISNFVLSNGNARGGAGGYSAGGGAGMGGGLFLNAGTLTLSNVQFSGNRAVGGAGGVQAVGGGGGGMGGSGGSNTSGGSGGGGFGINANVGFGSGVPGGPGAFANGAGGGDGEGPGGSGGTLGGGGGSGASFKGAGGGGVGGASAANNIGGAGGFGGGGGGAIGSGGNGGFGGGGGGHGAVSGGSGGFGAGGASGAAGGFGGGSGSPFDQGLGGRGGGGAGLGGDIFVRQGANLNIIDGGISSGTVVAGTADAGAGPGQALGAGIFLGGSVTYTVSSGNTSSITPDIGGGFDAQITGGFTKAGPGTLLMTTPNFGATFTGGILIKDSGTLAIADNGNLGDASNVLTFGGGSLRLINNLSIAHAINIPSGNIGTIDTNGTSSNIDSQISGGGELMKVGAGTLVLTSNNSYTGPTVAEAGTLAVIGGAINDPHSDIVVGVDPGVPATLTISSGGAVNNANAYLGQFAASNGSAVVSGAGSQWNMFSTTIGIFGAGVVTVADGAALNATATITLGQNFGFFASTGVLNIGTGGLAGTVSASTITNGAGNGTVNLNFTDTTSLPPMTGALSLNKDGSGTATLNGPSTYTGATTINQGTLRITNSGSFNSPITVAASGTLVLDIAQDIRLLQSVSGAGAINVSGNAMTARLLGNDSGFTGTFTLPSTARGMMFSNSAAGSAAAVWDISGQFGFIETGGIAEVQLGELRGSNPNTQLAAFGGAGLKIFQIGALGTDSTFQGKIENISTFAGGGTGVVELIKVGNGKLVLTNNNNYTGTTEIDAGVLALNNNGITNAWLPVLTSGGADIKGGRLVFDYNGSNSPQPLVLSTLDAGYDQPTKFSSGQLRTSNPADPNKGLGWIDNTSTKQVSVGYTYYGDDNLDGVVNTSDFTTLAQNFNGTGKTWGLGDFNYDGKVNALDFNALATNYGQPALATISPLGTIVPEPASAVLIAMGLAPLLRARRRRAAGRPHIRGGPFSSFGGLA